MQFRASHLEQPEAVDYKQRKKSGWKWDLKFHKTWICEEDQSANLEHQIPSNKYWKYHLTGMENQTDGSSEPLQEYN